jgi:3-deoxy-alpha-D-manno-octulosonate 8-oxidase
MVSSFLGGASLAGSYVGLVHPISSALSVVFGTHHGVANCMTMRAMADYYPIEYAEFWKYAERLGIEIPLPSNSELTPNDLDRLVSSTLMHEKPLSNALGVNYRSVIHKSELSRIFMKIVNG